MMKRALKGVRGGGGKINMQRLMKRFWRESSEMTAFVVIGHLARTDGAWWLNDMPGGAGRMDVLSRA